MVQKLPTFPELTKLVTRTRSFVNIFQLELFVDRCNPSLKSITFTALEPVEEVDPNQSQNKSMHLVIPQYSVEDLTIEGVSLIPNVILYLIHKFPRLKNLRMNEYGDSFGGRSAFFYLSVYGDKSTMGKFFKYMSRMNTFKIRGKLVEEQLADMMELYGSIIANNNDFTVVFSYDNVHHQGQYLRIDLNERHQKKPNKNELKLPNQSIYPLVPF